ncbi:hypothetical protein FBU30_004678 [Linnemannia zychae]|nr:hypothetical protein FBU30_004678 [Linnemannia zychae]
MFSLVVVSVLVLLYTLVPINHSFTSATPTKLIQSEPPKLAKRVLVPTAPNANDIGGAHIFLVNDVDSSTSHNSFLLLSKPRNYVDAVAACQSMFDNAFLYVPGSTEASELHTLLKKNAVAQEEIMTSTNFWILNTSPSIECLSLNKGLEKTEKTLCTTELPIICVNSAPRRTLSSDETSRQIAVDTAVGTFQGYRDQNSFRFLGIRYAEAPIGNLRFAAPVAKAPFESIVDATKYSYACPQESPSSKLPIALLDSLVNGAKQDEDCLNLNVYTPSLKNRDQKGLPVMFYIHGGGYVSFAGSTIIFEPGNLVSRGGVIVVSINYRLGMLGFTESPTFSRSEIPGNQAIHDQILALRWIKEHIANFGGDPNRVTVFGESAGATSIRALLSAPSTWDLYGNVIGQSDPINIPFKSAQDAATISTFFFEALECGPADLICARSKPVKDVLIAQNVANGKMLTEQNWTTNGMIERPTVDNVLISADFSDLIKSGKYNTKANIMWGTTKDESGRFLESYIPETFVANPSNYDMVFQTLMGAKRQETFFQSGLVEKMIPSMDAQELLNHFGTVFYFYCPLQYLSREMAAARSLSSNNESTTSSRIYNFRFNRGRNLPVVDGSGFCASEKHVCHSKDVIPVFGSGAVTPFASQTGEDAQFSRQIIDRWTTFAKTGNPNPTTDLVGVENLNVDVTSVRWLPYDEHNPTLELDLTSQMISREKQELCTFIEDKIQYDFDYRNPTHPVVLE